MIAYHIQRLRSYSRARCALSKAFRCQFAGILHETRAGRSLRYTSQGKGSRSAGAPMVGVV
jgi:hypothetical protein